MKSVVTRLLPKGQIGKNIVTLAGGTAAAQLVTICAMPAVTRLYSPAQMGVIALFVAFFGFWSPAQSLRYEYALLIASDDEESHVIYRLALFFVCIMSLLATPVLFSLQKAEILGFGLLPWWAPVAALPIFFGFGLFMVLRSWALRAGLVRNITGATISRAGARDGTRVILGLFAGGVPGLFIAELGGAWAAFVSLYKKTKAYYQGSCPEDIGLGRFRGVFFRYIKFALFETPSTFVNQLALTLPVPMIASVHGAAAAGWYGLARAMVGIPNTQVGKAVADVLQVELGKAVVAGDLKRGRRLFYKMLIRLSVFGLLPLIGTVVLAPWLMPIIFGSNWVQAGWAAAVIAPWLYAALVVSSLSRVLSVVQAQEYKLFYDFISVAFFVAAFVLSKQSSFGFLRMVGALSLAGILSYVIYLCVLLVVVESRFTKE